MDNRLELLIDAVREAGKVILKIQSFAFKIGTKANHEIVTEADIAVNNILKKRLLMAYHSDGWLSEESVDHAYRLKSKYTWIVDPIDGTKEFANKIPEYAISVALIENHWPIMSVVYNPATDELFYAVRSKGAWFNGKRMVCKSDREQLKLLASRSEYSRGEWRAFQHCNIKTVGSIAYKLALVADGRADATFSLGPKNEWDIAAGVLLMEEAGGFVADASSQFFVFNQSNVKVNGIIATSIAAQQEVLHMINARPLSDITSLP